MAHIIDTRKNLARESKFKNTHRHRHPFTLLEKMVVSVSMTTPCGGSIGHLLISKIF